MADEILGLYLENKLERKNAFKYLLPKLNELKEFLSKVTSFKRLRRVEKALDGSQCEPISLDRSNIGVWRPAE
jgi:hypothetical protein